YNPGGIARYVDNFARYLARDGHKVTVFGREEEARSLEIEPGYRYRSVVPLWNRVGEEAPSPRPDDHPSWPYNVLDYWGAFSFQMADAVMDLIREEGPPDAIEAQEYNALPYYLLQRKLTGAPELAGVPVVVNAHSPDFICRKFNEEVRYQLPHYWTGRLEMACLHAADAVICPSHYLSRQLEEEFGGSISVQALHLPWTDPEPYRGGGTVEEGKLLYTGRLELRKGVLRFLEACEKRWADGLSFSVRMIGSDTLYAPRNCTVGDWIRKKYAQRIAEGRLTLNEALPHGELLQEMRTAAATVVPSLWENWPNTCIEAMSLGKVVLGSVHGGQAEMIGDDERCGCLFSWEEPASFDRALDKVLALSSEERKAMGEAAKKRIAALCHPETVVPQRIRHFRETIAAHRPRKTFPFVNRRLREDYMPAPDIGKNEDGGLVSVVIPHYNLGFFLGDAVRSALAAEGPRRELVIVDDGSTEAESRAALAAVEREHGDHARVFRQRNSGLAAARNRGVGEARGRYVLLLDADDRIEPEFIERALSVLKKFENVHVVYSWERYFEASEDIYPCWNFELPYLLGHNMTCPVSLLYRQTYLRLGGSRELMAYNFEDYELWVRFVENGCGGVSLPEPLTLYRIRNDSMWQGSSREQHLYLQDLIARQHPDLFREYGPELFGLQNANGSAQKWIKPSAWSPFDEYEQWSRGHIRTLEEEAKKWWLRSVEAEKKLSEAENEKYRIWCERCDLERRLLAERQSGERA
ncbi:MAG: glycosyltransferase, partial [Verrucomicrobia bacterium]|nr:glycosyltransferase [Verrucomicrobiota bacterium]